MSKGLKALKDLRHNLNCMKTGKGFLNVIKDDECLDTIEKELKALEIIKEKEVNVYDFKEYESKYEYNKHTHDEFQELTQEDYDLLKEVLL